MDQMTLAQKRRRRRQHGLKPRSGHCKKRLNVVFACGGEPHYTCIDDLLAGESRLRHEPPHSRVKPENSGYDLLDYSHERVLTSDVKQFVTRDSMLP